MPAGAGNKAARKRLAQTLAETRKTITALIPGYFCELDSRPLLDDEWELGKADSVEYLEELLKVLRSDHMQEFRLGLSAGENVRLESLEITAWNSIHEMLEDVSSMSFHLALKHSLDVLWNSSWTAPAQNTLYLLWGHMAL